jgi:hypothetical protein
VNFSRDDDAGALSHFAEASPGPVAGPLGGVVTLFFKILKIKTRLRQLLFNLLVCLSDFLKTLLKVLGFWNAF